MSDAAPSEDLDALVARVDPDRWLSSRFIGEPQARADVVALYAYDHELARAPKVASNPILGEIRLAWWREVLDEIFEGRAVRHHPTAQALAGVVSRRSLGREPLEAMIDARYRELDPLPLTVEEAVAWAKDTGGRAASLATAILGAPAEVAHAGAAWALGRRAEGDPVLAGAVEALLVEGRREARRLGAAAFPAVAHAVFAKSRGGSAFRRQLRITWAVARGRI